MTKHLTPEQQALAEERLAEFFVNECDEIAADLGIEPRTERDWTAEEIARVNAENERRNRPWITADLLAEVDA